MSWFLGRSCNIYYIGRLVEGVKDPGSSKYPTRNRYAHSQIKKDSQSDAVPGVETITPVPCSATVQGKGTEEIAETG